MKLTVSSQRKACGNRAWPCQKDAGAEVDVAASPFPVWLPEVVADPVVNCPNDINQEARENQWSF